MRTLACFLALSSAAAAQVTGTIQYDVRTRRGTYHWVLRIADQRLVVERAREATPTTTFKLPAALLARMAAGQTTAGAAAITRRAVAAAMITLDAARPAIFRRSIDRGRLANCRESIFRLVRLPVSALRGKRRASRRLTRCR